MHSDSICCAILYGLNFEISKLTVVYQRAPEVIINAYSIGLKPKSRNVFMLSTIAIIAACPTELALCPKTANILIKKHTRHKAIPIMIGNILRLLVTAVMKKISKQVMKSVFLLSLKVPGMSGICTRITPKLIETPKYSSPK